MSTTTMSGPAGLSASSGPSGSFINSHTTSMPARAALLVGPVTTFFVLAMLAIGMRIYSRRLKKVSLRLSDYAIFVAATFAAGYLTICWLAVERGGIGYPLRDVPFSERRFTQKVFVAAWLVQTWANSFVRISILDFLYQVFRVKHFRTVVCVFHGLNIAYLLGCTITFFAICRPMKYNWEIGSQTAQFCGNLNLKFLLSAIFNLVLDACILILPMPMLWNLQLNSKRKKIALTFVFGLGILVVFATAWRTYHVVEFSKPASKMNFTMTITEDALWSGLEINLGIISACLPLVPPALSMILKLSVMRLLSMNKFGSNGTRTRLNETEHSRTPLFRHWRKRFSSIGSGSNDEDSTTSTDRHEIIKQVDYSVDIESASAETPAKAVGSEAWSARQTHSHTRSFDDYP